jgi:hypothetical protein
MAYLILSESQPQQMISKTEKAIAQTQDTNWCFLLG